jgi:ribulose-5-phosphate 4-epimerase/fuculose-1-phosphate aldolase
LPGPEEHLLINPFGLSYKEVTASNLVKMDLSGQIVGESRWPVNRAGVIIHTAIHTARKDVHVAMHTHTTAGCAIAGLDVGLDSNNFYAAQLSGQIAYHEFEGITLEPDERERLIASLGSGWFLVLRNHGLLTCGHSIPSAFFRMWTLQRACEIQLATMSASGQPRAISPAALERSSTDYQSDRQDSLARTAFDSLQRRIDEIDPSYRS